MGLVKESVIGGLWAASAVKVAGYTWSAFTEGWSALPGPGSPAQNSYTGFSPPTSIGNVIKDIFSFNHDLNVTASKVVSGAVHAITVPLKPRPKYPGGKPPAGVHPGPGR